MAKTSLIKLVTGGTLAILAAMAPCRLAAAPQTLDCELRDVEINGPGTKFDSQVAAEKRSVAVTFDDDTRSLTITIDGTGTPLKNVAISQTSMTGAAGTMSLGVDRSSWRIVFQTYGQGTARNEFGDCVFRH
jgi:hypothetical protein